MSMHRFPVNPRQTYSERMIAARAQLRQMVKEKLCESSWRRRAPSAAPRVLHQAQRN